MRWVFALLAACSSSPSTSPGWMAKAADSTSLAALSIPGTHESAALYEPLQGTAKCQNLNLSQQLGIGVRYFDIRCHDIADSFAIYHGPESEMQTFDDVLATMFGYLDAHPSETIMMSVKQEDANENATQSFEATFDTYVAKNPTRWYTDAAVPALGDVRGKIVLVRRFAATNLPLGIDASAWQDNTTFTLTSPAATLRVEDYYQVSSTDAKWTAIDSALTAARAATNQTLYLTYTSGYMTNAGIPNTPAVASVIDPMLETYLEAPDIIGAHLGVIAMDFVDGGHATHIIDANAL